MAETYEIEDRWRAEKLRVFAAIGLSSLRFRFPGDAVLFFRWAFREAEHLRETCPALFCDLLASAQKEAPSQSPAPDV
jgi:hypothetical protein